MNIIDLFLCLHDNAVMSGLMTILDEEYSCFYSTHSTGVWYELVHIAFTGG